MSMSNRRERKEGKRAKGRIGGGAWEGLQSPGGILCGAEVHRPWRPLRPLLACEAWSPFPRSHLRPLLTLAAGGPYSRPLPLPRHSPLRLPLPIGLLGVGLRSLSRTHRELQCNEMKYQEKIENVHET